MEPTAKTGFLAWWHRTPLYLRIIGGIILGVLCGVLLGPAAGSLAIPSKLVLRALGALAPGLILVAIVRALITATFEKGTAGKLLGLLLLNTIAAILIGIFVADTIKPGKWSEVLPVEHKPEITKADPLQQFLDNVPQSLLGPLGDNGKVLGVIILAVAFGIAFRKSTNLPTKNLITQLVEAGLEALITILHWVIDIVPLAVFGLVASIIGTKGFEAFHALGMFVVAVLVALFLQALYYLVRIYFSTWVNPFKLLSGMRDALVMAFSTGSSTITMPLTYECLIKRVGLREKSASLGALLGSNFNNDGTALYEAMAALFVSQMLAAHGLGQELTLMQQFLVVITSVLASVGAAGIPEAGLVTMTMVFHAVGLPTEYILVLLPVDWFLDRCRTVTNVMGDINVACIFDGKTRALPEEAGAAA